MHVSACGLRLGPVGIVEVVEIIEKVEIRLFWGYDLIAPVLS